MRRMYSQGELESLVQKIAASGQLQNVKIFENIVDKDGHERFIEGEIEMEAIENLTQTYGKWSLSGTHLLIVVCYSIPNGITTGYITKLCKIDIPQWVKDKIVASGGTYVATSSAIAYGSNDTTQSANCYLKKSDDVISIAQSSLATSADRNVRIQFDLLIDNE